MKFTIIHEMYLLKITMTDSEFKYNTNEDHIEIIWIKVNSRLAQYSSLFGRLKCIYTVFGTAKYQQLNTNNSLAWARKSTQ